MAKLTDKYIILTTMLFVLTSLLGACSSAELSPSAQAPSGSELASLTPSPAALPTVTPIPSLTPTPTFTRAPTHTPLPTYIPITPVLQGTGLPQSGPAISLSNASRLTLLARWGLGNPGDIQYTPDGQYLIIASTTGVYFFDPADHSLIKQLDTPYIALRLAVSPDSRLFAVAAPEQVYIYQIADFQLLHTFLVQANSLDFSPDGEVLALGINFHPISYIQFRRVFSGEILGSIESTGGIWDVEFSPQGNFIASAGYGAKVWSLDGSLTAEVGPHRNSLAVESISFSPDGSLLAAGSTNEIHIWRFLENGHLIHYREIDLTRFYYGMVLVVEISPDGRMMVAGSTNGVFIWDLETGSRVFGSQTSSTLYRSLAWSVDSQHITAASEESGIQVWEVRSEELLASLNANTGSFTSLAWSPNGQMLAAGAEQGWAYIINPPNGDLLQRVGDGSLVSSLAFSPDSQVLAVGYSYHPLQFWTIPGELAHTLDASGFGPTDVTFSSDGRLFAAILPDRQYALVRFWNTLDWTVESTYSVGNSDDYWITALTISPDQRFLAIVYIDRSQVQVKNMIQIVSFLDGELITTLEQNNIQSLTNNNATAFSPNGEMLALYTSEYFGDYVQVNVWRTSDWDLLYTRPIEPDRIVRGQPWDQPDALTWSADNTLLAVGVNDGSIQLLRARDGEILVTLPGHRMWAAGVAFSPDGRILASCSLDGTIMLWGTR